MKTIDIKSNSRILHWAFIFSLFTVLREVYMHRKILRLYYPLINQKKKTVKKCDG